MMTDVIALSAHPAQTTNRLNPQDDRALPEPDAATFSSVMGEMTEPASSASADRSTLAKSLNAQDGTEAYPNTTSCPNSAEQWSAGIAPELPATTADSILPLPQVDPNLPIPVVSAPLSGVVEANDPALKSRELPLAGIAAGALSALTKPGMMGKTARAEPSDRSMSNSESRPESSAQSFAADLAKNIDAAGTLLTKEVANIGNINSSNLPALDPTTAPSGDLVGAALTGAPITRPATLAIDAQLPLHSPRFGESFAQQVTVLVDHGIQTARISLNPPELGPVDVRITLQQDEATVHFASQHGVVREAMTDALPRLRELLEQAGVRLNDSGVFAQLPQREHAAGQPDPRTPELNANLRSPVIDPALTAHTEMRALRLVDAYV